MDIIMYIVGVLILIIGAVVTLVIDIQRFRRPWWNHLLLSLFWFCPYKEYIIPKRFRSPED